MSDDTWDLGRISDGSFPKSFIQWKGTNVCIDLYCTCGKHSHYDGDFLYRWQCPACKKCWEMGTAVRMRPCEADDDWSIQHPELC